MTRHERIETRGFAGRAASGGREVVDFGPLADLAGFMLRLAQLRLFESFYRDLGADQTTPGQIGILATLARNPGVRQGVLAEALRIKRSNMAKIIRLLESTGMIRREVPSDDRRAVELHLTAQGSAFVRDVSPKVIASDRAATAVLAGHERATLLRLLVKLAEVGAAAVSINLDDIVAIDIHTHAEEPCGTHADDGYDDFQAAMATYFKSPSPHPPTIPETAAYYRERKIACVIFPVDAERESGFRRYKNEEVAELAGQFSDIMIPFASIDPAKGKIGAREARRLVAEFGVRGFKFHPTMQGFYPNDRSAYVLYEAIAEAGVPALFHTGQTAAGSGMRGGSGMRLKYSNPIYLDDVAVDFPEMQIILAHPSFPWQEEALAVAQHKPNVYIDLSGWSPKYFPPILVKYANSILKHKMLFGSDWPGIAPDRWLADFATLDIKPEVRPLILKENARRLLKLS